MFSWILRQIVFVLLLCTLLILGITGLATYYECLCVSVHVQQEHTTEFRFIDIVTGSQYTRTPHEFLGQAIRAANGESISYTYQDSIISLKPEDAQLLADRSPALAPDSPWLAYLPPMNNISVDSPIVYFVVYSYTVGGATLNEVHLLDLNAGQLRRLFSPRSAVASLTWSHDYQSVFTLTSNRDILRYDMQTGIIQTQANIYDRLATYGHVTNARISRNAEWVSFIRGIDSLVLLNLPDDRTKMFDLDVDHVMNAIWWE